MRIFSLGFLVLTLTLAFQGCKKREHWIVDSEIGKLRLETITDSLIMPFAMVFLPDGNLLVSDRPRGEMLLVNVESGAKTKVKGVPQVHGQGDSGLLDIILDPDFKNNKTIYFDYTLEDSTGFSMAVERAELSGDNLTNRKRLFTAQPYFKDQSFYGSRLLLHDGYLFITTGVDNGKMDSAQKLSNHLGKIMRIKKDGTVPDDNPFVGVKGALPEIWCYGNRNPQGLAIHPETGELWSNEHGPKGGDEVNIIRKGRNYGWPVITYGMEYNDTPIGQGISEKEGMEQPVYYYLPSIAPSGLLFYTGDAFPQWKGNLFIGGMKLTHLNRLVLSGDSVIREERIIDDKEWRVRNVIQSPEGYLYISTDTGLEPGRIIRIKPE
ncbi:MAG: PQQ-dependent sugar dehydrogenase [Bacteroidetes bacterium]|nr:PQQ-dependent sugar dehydrogenase [Bacteroidota bacterium]